MQSTAHLLDANTQIAAARTASAEKYAPYEWTSANLYLHQARLLVGYSEYEAAVNFAGKASKFASEAREKALAEAAVETPAMPAKPTQR